MNIQIKDCVGNTIRTGSKIAYPVRRGANMEMRTGKVTSIRAQHQGQGAIGIVAKVKTDKGRTVDFQSFGRCVVTD